MHRLPGRRNDPMGLLEKNRAERKIKEGEMISVSFARTWSTTAHAGRLPGRRRPLAHRSVVVAAPFEGSRVKFLYPELDHLPLECGR